MPDQASCRSAHSVTTMTPSGVPQTMLTWVSHVAGTGRHLRTCTRKWRRARRNARTRCVIRLLKAAPLTRSSRYGRSLPHIPYSSANLAQAYLPCKLPGVHLRIPCSMSCKGLFSSPYHSISVTPTAGSSSDFVYPGFITARLFRGYCTSKSCECWLPFNCRLLL